MKTLNELSIGWIGLGNMGLPMAQNLVKAGYHLNVYNRDPKKSENIQAKAIISESLESLISHSDIIFTMLSNDDAVRAVYEKIKLTNSIKGKIFIDMSTVSPRLSEALSEELQQQQAAFLDAPVAGSTGPAKDGTLVIMVGGAAQYLKMVKPLFDVLGKLTIHAGANGKGSATKIAVNYYLSIVYLGLAEASLFAKAQGLDISTFMEVINNSAVGSGATKVKTPKIIEQEYTPAFGLDLMLKDIMIAKNQGANFGLTSSLINTYQEAKNAGYGQDDVIGIIQYLQDQQR